VDEEAMAHGGGCWGRNKQTFHVVS
jgi:hypothetical protein